MIKKLILAILIFNATTSCSSSTTEIFDNNAKTNSTHERSEKNLHKQVHKVQTGIDRSLQQRNKQFNPRLYKPTIHD